MQDGPDRTLTVAFRLGMGKSLLASYYALWLLRQEWTLDEIDPRRFCYCYQVNRRLYAVLVENNGGS